HAAEAGQTEVQVYRFPNELCSDRGRRINNSEPEWETTLEGRPKAAYEFWHDHLRPLGFGLKAEVLEYPGGLPGDIACFLTWKETGHVDQDGKPSTKRPVQAAFDLWFTAGQRGHDGRHSCPPRDTRTRRPSSVKTAAHYMRCRCPTTTAVTEVSHCDVNFCRNLAGRRAMVNQRP